MCPLNVAEAMPHSAQLVLRIIQHLKDKEEKLQPRKVKKITDSFFCNLAMDFNLCSQSCQ